MHRESLKTASRLVVKLGTGVLTDSRKQLDLAQMDQLVGQIAAQRKAGKEIVLVTSGAVGAGMGALGCEKRPVELAELQACAAVGQSRLMTTYERLFSRSDLNVAQVLLTHDDLQHHERHLNARNTLVTLLARGVVPIINLEWIQKLQRDKSMRGYSTEAVTDTILRRMHDYVHYICPQFAHTHVNFQRVPIVDTSNPFIARFIPTPDESMLVIRFANPRGIDFPYLLSMLDGSFMSRANTIVCPGGKMDLAMQLIFTPMIWRLMERRKQALER